MKSVNPFQQLDRRLRRLETEQVQLRLGTVVDDAPFTVSVGDGENVVGIGRLDGTTYTAGNVVVLLCTSSSQLVIGRLI